MGLTEGIIRFAYDLRPCDGAVADDTSFRDLAAWRSMLRKLELIGQVPGRYGGAGYGNLSARDLDRPDEFVITASQTGGEEHLAPGHLVRVTYANLERFWIEAAGELPPSSESMTHAMIYASEPRISWIFHCHSPDLWRAAESLALPCTPPEVRYGSPDMVSAVAELFERHHSRPLLFATLGHEDGIFSCGGSARDAGGLLLTYLAKALALEIDL